MASSIVKGKLNVIDDNNDVQTIYPETSGDKVIIDRNSNASVIPNDVANLQHIVNKMGSLALKSKINATDFDTDVITTSMNITEPGKIVDARVVKTLNDRITAIEDSDFITVEQMDAGLATKPDTQIDDSITSTFLTWSSKKISDYITTINSNYESLKSRLDSITS